MPRIARGFLFLLFASSSLLFAADCAGLKNLQLADTQITFAEIVTSGDFETTSSGWLHNLPQFCRVAGQIRPTADSKIRFEVWLPVKGWNGHMVGTGNGGFAGTFYYQQMGPYLKRGFAALGSDAGHQAEGTDSTWAYGHPEKVKDFGWRAIHLTAERGKELVSAYYGKPADKSYFESCSDGGREGLMEAQRFPEDYDGIMAGAPAAAWSTSIAAGVRMVQRLSNPADYIPDRKLPAIQRAVLAACDELDGVKDGIIGDPSQCHFDPQVLLCKQDDELDCLTQPQIGTLKLLYGGAVGDKNTKLAPGVSMGDETGWKDWIIGMDPNASYGVRYVINYFRYMVASDPKLNVLTADPNEMLRRSKEKNAANLDAVDPDLSRFAARGGKLILFHGWDDPAIPPGNTIIYFESVEKQMGADKTGSFARLYMVPGMEHCGLGPGANSLGQYGGETSARPKYGLFDSLENWVEKGSPLENVVATHYEVGADGTRKPGFTRPLCSYPKVARYLGSGDTNDAANFACVAP
ncbi:MAG: tannase/feruloyl esterase family alpha/beta hydrolase [Terracidiphilus sp.]